MVIRYPIRGGYSNLRSPVEAKTQHLIALAQEGSEAALNQLCTVYGPRILWLIRLRMGKEVRSKLESIDLAQDVLVHAVRDLQTFTYKNEGDFVRWLARITENRLRDNLDVLHAAKRDIRKEVPFNMPGATGENSFAARMEPIVTTTPSVIVSRKEEFERLSLAIDRLKQEYREVIILTKIEGLSYLEIAEKLGKSADAIRMLACRAMAALSCAFENV